MRNKICSSRAIFLRLVFHSLTDDRGMTQPEHDIEIGAAPSSTSGDGNPAVVTLGLIACLLRGAVLLVISLTLAAETQAQWTFTPGGSGADEGWGVTTDAEGNIYHAASFQETVLFGDTTLHAMSTSDRVITKYTPSGEILWARSEPGVRLHALLAADGRGNTFVAEGFWSDVEVQLGDSTFVSRGLVDHLLAKYSPDGSLLWSKHVGGPNLEGIFGMAADKEGSLYVAGGFYGETVMGSDTLAGNGFNHTIYLAKFSADGELIWVDRPGSTCSDWTEGVGLDAEGNAYIVGRVGCDGTFGEHALPADGETVFLARYDTDGVVEWVISAAEEQTGNHYPSGIAVAADRIFIVGTFSETLDFGTTALDGGEGESMYAAGYTTSGEFEWASMVPEINPDDKPQVWEQGRGIRADAMGRPVVYGLSSVPQSVDEPGSIQYFAATFDASGAELWTRGIGHPHLFGDVNSLTLFDVAADPFGGLLLSGSVAGTTELFGDTLTSKGTSDIFLLRTSIEEVLPVVPLRAPPSALLHANHPNPFTTSTAISFSLNEAGPVSLVIYDVRGREVRRLLDGWMASGDHAATFDASTLANGVYVYRLISGSFAQTNMMVHLK